MEHDLNRLVIAAYRLPFKVVKTKTGTRAISNSGGLVSAIISLSESFKNEKGQLAKNNILWAGTTGKNEELVTSIRLENKPFEIFPVPVPSEVNELYYGGFCNDLVWPLFHYFPSYSVFNNSYFEAYQKANEIFCAELVKIIKPGDLIWIHDYQLMLLPQMIRQHFPDATIGFFLHIPFPSFDIFRLIPRIWREKILRGMLGADLIGFHTNDYTQYFLKAVRRTVGFESRQNQIFTKDRIIKADAFPIGIDYKKYNLACLEKGVVDEKQKLRNYLAGQKLIFSVDRLDYSKGLLFRLQGFETFLEKYPHWHGRVVFNMVVVPSRDNIGKYKEMKKEIESSVGRINGKYGSLSWRPIIYQYKSLTFRELIALYDISDVGLITPIRDGMNLVAKEFIACQSENKGVLILSEMAGAAAELSEAIIINPVDNYEMAEAILVALEMQQDEKNFRLLKMQERISSYDVFAWANDYFGQIKDVKEHQESMSIRIINQEIRNNITEAYRKGSNRYLFLDYDGTLVSFAKYPEWAILDESTLQLVKKLADNPNNKVVIISGRDRLFLEKQFKGIDVTLVAEHGYYIRNQHDDWYTTLMVEENWKDAIRPVMMEYVNRCQGSMIEEKTGCIAWHYRNVETDYAHLRLHELRDDLSEIIRSRTNFEISEGNKVLEVKSGKFDKGQAAMIILKDIKPDFILAAGDDNTDELLFNRLPRSAFSIKIGLRPSAARFNVPDFGDLISLLEEIS